MQFRSFMMILLSLVLLAMSSCAGDTTIDRYELHEESARIDAVSIERSGQWRSVRDKYVSKHPECIACGKRDELYVHHIIPFHVDRSLELVESNLVTFCLEHHLDVGHNGNWRDYNPNCIRDAAAIRKQLSTER